MRLVVFLLMTVMIYGCKNTYEKKIEKEAIIKVRLGYKFYKIEFDEKGYAKASKGLATEYTQPFKEEKIEATKDFKVSNIDTFFNKLEKLKKDPVITGKRLDAARVEISFQDQKVYDSYSWDSDFWNIVRPVMTEIPSGFNPFTKRDDW